MNDSPPQSVGKWLPLAFKLLKKKPHFVLAAIGICVGVPAFGYHDHSTLQFLTIVFCILSAYIYNTVDSFFMMKASEKALKNEIGSLIKIWSQNKHLLPENSTTNPKGKSSGRNRRK